MEIELRDYLGLKKGDLFSLLFINLTVAVICRGDTTARCNVRLS